jgi:hypothetical protein
MKALNCDRARELVSDSLDGALAESIAERFHEHLSGCAPCRVFHEELKESLLLLEEIPTYEVGDEFDKAVWKRIREQNATSDLWSAWKARLGFWREVSWDHSLWKWSPVGVAAGILMMVVISSGPVPSTNSAAVLRTETALSATAPNPNEQASKEMVSLDIRGGEFEEAEGETPAGMPEAIEAYLLRNSRDLRLQADRDRFRRSNYSYPLRRVQDPSFYRVSGGRIAPQPAVRRADTEPDIIAF